MSKRKRSVKNKSKKRKKQKVINAKDDLKQLSRTQAYKYLQQLKDEIKSAKPQSLENFFKNLRR